MFCREGSFSKFANVFMIRIYVDLDGKYRGVLFGFCFYTNPAFMSLLKSQGVRWSKV